MDLKAQTEHYLDRTLAQAERHLNFALVRLLSKTLPDERGCLLWCGHRNHRGAGVIWIGRRRYHVHHAAYMLLVGPLPDGWCRVRQLCNNPRCVNPSHLVLGTRKET